MSGRTWADAVEAAVRRHVFQTGSAVFTRQAFVEAQFDAIIADTGFFGLAPFEALRRELRYLRDVGVLEAGDNGALRLRDAPGATARSGAAYGVLCLTPDCADRVQASRLFRFDQNSLPVIGLLVGKWVLYHLPGPSRRGNYYAMAKVERIEADPMDASRFVAMMTVGSFVEFAKHVPFYSDKHPVERSLIYPNGRINLTRVAHQVRLIGENDFNRIVALGSSALDYRMALENEQSGTRLRDDLQTWDGAPVRGTELVSRTVRDQQFRESVLDTYSGMCAFTGLRLTDVSGRLETQAAHIKSVSAGGPDQIQNAIALSATIHSLFDNGMLSMSDQGEILISSRMTDKRIKGFVFADRRARLPIDAWLRPDHSFLRWHRTKCFNLRWPRCSERCSASPA